MKKSLSTLFLVILFLPFAHASEIKDFLYKQQWGLTNTGQSALRWENELLRTSVNGIRGIDINWKPYKTTGNDREIIVAILDHGIELNHPDLKGRIWNNPKCDNNSDTSKIPCHGFDFLEKTTNIQDTIGHGTQVAGIIAANQNQIGIVGVTPKNIKLMPLKVLNDRLDGINSAIYTDQNGKRKYLADIWADAIRFAVQNKADVINMSMGWPKYLETPKLKKSVEMALANNVVIVVAPGNNGKEIQTFPCSYNGVICVGAIDNTGAIPEYSNYGGKVDILAPGDAIVSTIPEASASDKLKIRYYDSAKGTSFATPFITGIVATIKLKYPNITNDEVLARLFSTARNIKTSNKKFTKYGLVDMQAALNIELTDFVSPIYKQMREIPFLPKTGTFSFNLPIKSYLSDLDNLNVKFITKSKDLSFDKVNFTLEKVNKGETVNIIISGHIKNYNGDYKKSVIVKIFNNENKLLSQTRTSLYFARNLTDDPEVKDIPITGINPKLISFFRGEQKVSRLRMVSDKYHKTSNPEYYTIDPKLQKTKGVSTLTLLKMKNGTIKPFPISLPKVSKVLSIFRIDANFDNKLDYFIYSLVRPKKENGEKKAKNPYLLFSYIGEDLQPLYGDKSHWKFPITTFEGLPLREEGEVEWFNWQKVNTPEFGSILVPAIHKAWKLQGDDTSDDILDMSSNMIDFHFYYLYPELISNAINVKIKAFDNSKFYNDIRDGNLSNFGLDAQYYEIIQIQKPFFQNQRTAALGRNEMLIAIGENFERRYFLITLFDNEDFSIIPFPISDSSFLARNTIMPILDLKNMTSPLRQSAFIAKLDRANIRVKLLDPSTVNSNFSQPLLLKSKSWGDKIFDFIGGFNDEKKSIFIESRFNLYALDSKGEIGNLPVNRDTSFPALGFTDMLKPLSIQNSNGDKFPAVHIDASLISHEHIYTMVKHNGVFNRPLNLSIKVPKNCAVEKPKRFGVKGSFYYVLLCKNNQNQLFLKTIPMKIR